MSETDRTVIVRLSISDPNDGPLQHELDMAKSEVRRLSAEAVELQRRMNLAEDNYGSLVSELRDIAVKRPLPLSDPNTRWLHQVAAQLDVRDAEIAKLKSEAETQRQKLECWITNDEQSAHQRLRDLARPRG